MRTGVLEGQMGLDRALERVSEDWKARAAAALDGLIAEGIEFDAETLRDRAGELPAGSAAIGALLRNDSRIETVGLRTSSRPTSHGRRLFVYRAKGAA